MITLFGTTLSIDSMTVALDWLGILVFATTGALVASRKEMDVVGFALLATVTGGGGGRHWCQGQRQRRQAGKSDLGKSGHSIRTPMFRTSCDAAGQGR